MNRKTRQNLLPGGELVEQGMRDLAGRRVTDLSLLVLIASPRLKRLGHDIPAASVPKPYEHQLYARLEQRLGTGAHSYYNSLIRRVVSYEHALEREQSNSSQRSSK